MFHVSTFLPHSEKDLQHVERKRHIGNDRVAIVFQDRDTLFSPKIIKSRLLHVFIIVQPVLINNETKRYKVKIYFKTRTRRKKYFDSFKFLSKNLFVSVIY